MNALNDRLGTRLYLDANIYIYAIEGYADYASAIRKLFSFVEQGDVQIIASQLLLAELLPQPIKHGDDALLAQYTELLREHPKVRLVPVSENVILRGTALRAEHSLKTVDALHLATALEHGCDSFVTNDRGFPDLDDIHMVDLSRDFGS